MRGYLNESSQCNEIRLLLRHPKHRGKTVVVLEGETDIKLFRKLFSSSHLSQSVDGKNHVENVVFTLQSEGVKKVVGICDADFDHLKSLSPQCSSVFLTDHHDAEVMLIRSPSLKAIFDEYAKDRDAHKRLSLQALDSIVEAASPLGVLRLINHDHDLNINFKGLHVDQFCEMDGIQIRVNTEKLINVLLHRSKKVPKDLNPDVLQGHLNAYLKNSYDPYQLCCGHDLTKFLAWLMRQKDLSSTSNLNNKTIESALRLSFTFEAFKETQLYQSLDSWQKQAQAQLFA